MSKPSTLKDLLAGGHINKSEVRKIARDIFDGTTTGAGPEGYVVTSVAFDDLDERLQGYVIKTVLEFKVENVFDTHPDDEDEPVEDDEDFEPPTVDNEVV